MCYRGAVGEADEVVDAVKQLGRRAIAVQADVADADAARAAVRTAVSEFGRLDIL